MANFFKNNVINTLLLCSTAVTLPLSAIIPCQMATNVVNLSINIKAKIKKLQKCKTSSKRISCMLSIKRECEQYIGGKIDMSYAFNLLEAEFKNRNVPIDGRFSEFKKAVKKKDKRHKALVNHLAGYLEDDESGISLIEELEMTNYPSELDEKAKMSGVYEIGISLVLAGIFLKFVPNPTCQAWSPRVIDYGIGVLTGKALQDCYDH
jgi:hypothetical protein